MDLMNDIYEAKELLSENLHELVQHVKQNCNGDLLNNGQELCDMTWTCSGCWMP